MIGSLPPVCPGDNHSGVPYPSVVTIYFATAIFSLAFAIICGKKYNQLHQYDKKLHTENFPSKIWTAYFALIGIK